ncbi:uncharacterized protein LOC124164340 [Ischnura elegans]|uniref:uncharacterized protein LOC124164340 n=1 Tax=Ischnura elegans TaxID=197161 RepID=UPI001ED8A659|nr:uncharacterized protein LOC124164340 [Ischnura elegans]
MAYFKNILIIQSLLLGIFAVTSGQKVKLTECPTLTSDTSEKLTFANLVGTWKVIAATPSIHHPDWKCTTYTFNAITANSKYSIGISGRRPLFGTSYLSGTATVTGVATDASTAWTYLTFDITDGSKTYKWNYYIVLTDDDTFIALFACEPFLFGRIESFLLLAKSGVSSTSVTTALDTVANYGVTRSDLVYPHNAQCL